MAVNIKAVMDEIYTDFSEWWPTAGNTSIAFENIQFNPTRGESFVRIEAMPNVSRMLEVGGSDCAADVLDGIFSVQIFVKAENGAEDAYDLAQLILNRYTRKTLTYCYFDSGQIPLKQIDPNSGMYQMNLVLEFHAIN